MVSRTFGAHKSARPSPDCRRQAVLSTIIEEHLVSGDAVGSHAVSDKFSHASGWSSATIRNVMGELEELGLLEQPHTSAGRVPTDKGYRFYVDNLLGDSPLSKNDLKAIESIGVRAESMTRPDRLMEKASHVLSELSENVGIVVWPAFAEYNLREIRFLRLSDRRVLVVQVSTSNIVHDKVIALAEEFSQDELDRASRYLNSEFRGKSLIAIRAEIIEIMREQKALYDRVIRNAVFLCEQSLQDEDATAEVFLDGASNILTKPEFLIGEHVRELFRTFEEKSRLVEILNRCVLGEPSTKDVKVVIGRENAAISLKHCAVITSSYRVGVGGVSGTLGVVGPMRIEYGRMMAVVNYLARFIERALASEQSQH